MTKQRNYNQIKTKRFKNENQTSNKKQINY